MKRLTDPDFAYVNAASTDIRKRFDAINPNWNKKPERAPAAPKVTQIRRKSK